MREAFSGLTGLMSLEDSVNVPQGHKVRLTDGDDVYIAGNSGEYILGLKGDDRIAGGKGEDLIFGDAGDDKLEGGKGSDHLEGGKDNDDLIGGVGGDQLYGGDGDDQLFGQAGADILSGGLGRDLFGVNEVDPDGKRDVLVYGSVEDSISGSEDQVSFFQPGEDKFDFSAIDANSATPEDDAFTFIGDDAFSGAAGELRFANSYLTADVDGDSLADFEIHIVSFAHGNDQMLRAHDFVL